MMKQNNCANINVVCKLEARYALSLPQSLSYPSICQCWKLSQLWLLPTTSGS